MANKKKNKVAWRARECTDKLDKPHKSLDKLYMTEVLSAAERVRLLAGPSHKEFVKRVKAL